MAAIPAAIDTERQFTILAKVDTHMRKADLSVVYTNDPIIFENSIKTIEHLPAKDDKYKVVGFDLEYTCGRAGYDKKVEVAQFCVCHHVLVYHYFLTTRPCKHIFKYVNNPDYKFARVDTTNDLKVLKTLCVACQKLVHIQGQYRF
ncbi:hypothetical protein D1007_22878 [Hordeum vulgare]|nr:hypothetical protein D1007_22878 [Hordeum vulgare]